LAISGVIWFPARLRTLTITAEDRTRFIPAEVRTLAVPVEDRTTLV
jgi:hypothetical protein